MAGSVRALGGPGLAGVCVTAIGPSGAVHGFTAAGGRYLLSGLRPGEYRLGFRACAAKSGRYVSASFARPVLVVAGHPTSLRPVILRPLSPMAYLAASARASGSAASSSEPQISGTVTDSRGKPLAGICVGARSVDTGGGPPPVGPEVKTGRHGTYLMRGGLLNAGRWKVAFFRGCGNKGNFAPQWWKFAGTENKAKVVVIHDHTHLTGINARLDKGASISGTVRAGSNSGPGLPGACVEADALAGDPDEPALTKTGPGGKYLITGLGTGRYSVFFDSGCGNKGDFIGDPISPIVSVTDGKTTKGVDGFLLRAGAISGTVTGTDHRPLAGICVEGQSQNLGFGDAFEASTGPTGQYSVDGLEPGHYEISFSAGCGSKGSFAPQFYKNQVSGPASNPVLIKAGATAGGIDAVMRPGGIVTGTVTGASGKKLTGVCVLLERQSEDTGAQIDILIAGDGTVALPFGAIGRTAAGGKYRVINLPAGNYTVSFSSGCQRHAPVEGTQWFSPQGGDRASLLTVGQGTVGGVNAKLPAPGTITGVVRGPTGKPARGICVFPQSLTGGPSNTLVQLLVGGNFGLTNKHGGYRLTGLAAGKYGLQFIACESRPLAPQWYRQATEFSGLTPVVVRAGHVKTGVNEKLVTGQSVSGRITRAGSSQPVGNACINAVDGSGDSLGFGRSKKDGTYKVPHLAAGTYSLQVGQCDRQSLANVVRPHVKLGSSRPLTGINVALPAAGLVTGLVTGGSPAGAIGGVCVTATPQTGAGETSSAFSTFDGKYSVGGLAPGKYRVEFSSLCVLSPGGFVSQWFDGQATRGLATPVGVAAGKVTGPVDATLATDGAISGSVRVSGSARAGVCVLAFPRAGVQTPTVGVTDGKGGYLIGGLSPGRYVVEFTGGCGVASYHTQWFDGASSRSHATPVAVQAGRTTTGISAH
jgi:hypothetical protein